MLKDFAVAQIAVPETHSAGAVTTAAVDCKGYSSAIIVVELGLSTALGFSHCDLYTSDLPGGTADRLLASAVPGGTEPDAVLAFSVDLQDADRYLFLTLALQGAGTAVISALAILMDPKLTPIVHTNLSQQLIVP